MRQQTQHGEEVLGTKESRAHERLPVHSLAYVELSDDNAGLILNISETGIAVQAVQVLTTNQFPRMRFRLPGTEIPVEAAGRLVWQIRSKKEAGIEFVGLPETARMQIRDWIAAEPSRVAAAVAKQQEKVDPLRAARSSTSPTETKPSAGRQVPSRKPSDGDSAPAAQNSSSSPAGTKFSAAGRQAPSHRPSGGDSAQPDAHPPAPQNLSSLPDETKPPARRQVPSHKPSDGDAAEREAADTKPLSEQQVQPSEPSRDDSLGRNGPSPTPSAQTRQPKPKTSPEIPRPPASTEWRPGRPGSSPPVVAGSPAASSPPPSDRKWTEAPPGYGWRSAMDRPQPGREQDPLEHTFRERAPVMPQWNGYVAPGVGMEYRGPRRWWTYTAVLGLLAAVGFAGLMMINPDSINRARIQALMHEPGSTATDAQSAKQNQPDQTGAQNSAADSNATTAQPPSEPTPSIPTDLPKTPDENGGAAASPEERQPSGSVALPSASASEPSARSKQPNAVPPANSKNSNRNSSSSQPYNSTNRTAPNTKAYSAPSSSGASGYASRSGAQMQNPSGYQSTPSNQPPASSQSAGTPRQPQTTANPPATNTTPALGASSVNSSPNNASASQKYQPQPNQRYQQPTPPANSYSAPAQRSSKPPLGDQSALDAFRNQTTARSGSSAGSATAPSSQPTTQQPAQRDQDAYARASSPSTNTSSATTSGAVSQPQAMLVEIQGASSPIPPSVPLSGVPSGSVGGYSQFHAIRIPPDMQYLRSQLAGNLQFGQLVSSYSPAYPIGAAREGIEGTVKLDVLVGRDGTVRNVSVASGPPMLASAAANAVRDWRYSETFLARQPIETQQWVTIVFRLAK